MIARALLCASVVLASAGCCCEWGRPPEDAGPINSSSPSYRPPAPVVSWKFSGEHPIPPQNGGGWDATKGPHTHLYAPEPMESFKLDGESYVWTGPVPTPTPAE